MRRNLLDMEQPFGEVHDTSMMGSGSNSYGSKNSISDNRMEVPNHHTNHSVSDADKRAGSPNANSGNPFAWTGHPEKG